MCDVWTNFYQYAAPICLIPLMGEWISEAINQETEQVTPATVAMSYKVTLLEFAKTMDNGLEMHQPVNVKVRLLFYWWKLNGQK